MHVTFKQPQDLWVQVPRLNTFWGCAVVPPSRVWKPLGGSLCLSDSQSIWKTLSSPSSSAARMLPYVQRYWRSRLEESCASQDPWSSLPRDSAVGYPLLHLHARVASCCTDAIMHCQLHGRADLRHRQQGWTSFGSLREDSLLLCIFLDCEECFHRRCSSGASVVWCGPARAAHPLLAMTPLCVAQSQHTVMLTAALLSCLLVLGSRRTGNALPWKVTVWEVFHNPLAAFLCRPWCKCWPLPT